ncbi:MAG: MaoC family dehydratase N-terminal domain-containing protein [Ectothiorhodospiraceae bacterium]|nr:MaoC family dehydratase N-terminal domain-containing protein [Ectothiorhodospiraceae bacterium]MCH8506698.1 MaoC family dehydratase N-terminal domain-containing protein [Ectothiorhodospiraceae bacterium]
MAASENDLQSWIGKTETTEDTITRTPVTALAATLDRPDAPDGKGDALPPLWHWLYFLPTTRASQLGPDGHAARGEFLPPVSLPRRMWAGSRFTFHQPLRVGEQVSRTSRIKNVANKQGRTGALVIVTVQHEIHGESGLAITEEQDLAYREAPKPGAPTPPPAPAPAEAQWSHEMAADPVLLFRYSALTFNGHRIHYDYPYTTQVEGYPGLVVHGPLILTLLVEGLTREHPDRAIGKLSMRAMRPLFHDTPFSIQGRLSDDGREALLWSLDAEGAVTMQATAELTG